MLTPTLGPPPPTTVTTTGEGPASTVTSRGASTLASTLASGTDASIAASGDASFGVAASVEASGSLVDVSNEASNPGVNDASPGDELLLVKQAATQGKTERASHRLIRSIIERA